MTTNQDWQMLFLGGNSGSGKSHSAREIANSTRCSWLQLDSVWLAMTGVTTAESHPALHLFREIDGPWFDLMEDERLAHFIEATRQVSLRLPAVVAQMLETKHRTVIEGVWFTPAFTAAACTNPQVRTVFIVEGELSEIEHTMTSRREGEEPTPRQRALARLSWAHAQWLRIECQSLGIPVLEARPRATLTERVAVATA